MAPKHNLKTFTIVSDPLHMKRATLMANNMGMKTYSSPTQSSAYQTLNSKIPFLFREVFFYIGYRPDMYIDSLAIMCIQWFGHFDPRKLNHRIFSNFRHEYLTAVLAV
ncbi:hypothetical protein ACP8HI_01870 [Paenibacillus sp. FA6]|uniref:hypothetical protein n=1 Tax=Paenibacillus sp. FA6 TaxID=3413029 RepID=UPI003F6555C8